MTPRRRPPERTTVLVTLIAAVTVLFGSLIAVPWLTRHTTTPAGTWQAGTTPGYAGGMMGNGMMGGQMMGGRVWLAGNGVAVTSIAAARSRADQAAAPSGLHPGEVIQFSNNVYVELKNSSGEAVTEVLIDPASGTVSTEPGPAMMWNTGSRTAAITPDQARTIAGQWLTTHRGGDTVAAVDAYPGYYTLDTSQHAMLSINAATGAVWSHTWHGTYIAGQDA